MTLEKIINKVKDAGKSIVEGVSGIGKRTIDFCKDNYQSIVLGTAFAVGGAGGAYTLDKMMVGEAKAWNIKTSAFNTGTPSSGPTSNLKTSGTNVNYITPPSGNIGIYFKNLNQKLKEKVTEPNTLSQEDMYAEIISGTGGEEYWMFNISDDNNLEWKNIIGYRYGQNGINDQNAPSQDIVDIKYKNGTWFNSGSFSVSSGIYDRWKFKEFNHADHNRSGNVDFVDFAIQSNNSGRTGIVKGSNPNDANDYTDIDGDGDNDMADMALFSAEWLWDANDPNTW